MVSFIPTLLKKDRKPGVLPIRLKRAVAASLSENRIARELKLFSVAESGLPDCWCCHRSAATTVALMVLADSVCQWERKLQVTPVVQSVSEKPTLFRRGAFNA